MATSDPAWAVAIAITDHEALEQADERLRDKGDQPVDGTYRGVEYDQGIDDRTGYSATMGDLLVLGSLEGLRASIDAWRGESLADAPRFDEALADITTTRSHRSTSIRGSCARQLRDVEDVDPQIRRAFRSRRLAQANPVTASLTANADEIVLEAVGDAELIGDAIEEDEAAVTVGELPGDAWLALATPPLGPLLRDGARSRGHPRRGGETAA